MKFADRSLVPSLTISAVLVAAFCLAIGIPWLGQPFSNQELLANFAHAADFARGVALSGFWPWWTPQFLGGTSLAPFWASVLSSAWLGGFVALFGSEPGLKLAALVVYGLGGLAQFGFVRSLTRSSAMAACAAIAFLLLPSQLVRLGTVEHFVVTVSFACLPLAFWGIRAFVRNPSPGSGVLAAAACSLLVLSYSKTAALALPALLLFAIASVDRSRGFHLPTLKQLSLAALAFLLLGVLPNLPGMREWRHFILFDLAPFTSWQQAFSIKSAVLWFDRSDWLTAGMSPLVNYTVMKGSQYLGLVTAVLFGVLFLFRRPLLFQSASGGTCRLFLALALLQHWFSFGPHSVLGAQMKFLELANGAPVWTPAVSWLVLALQGWLCFVILPRALPARQVIGSLLCLVYFAVPGFRLLGWLPFYADVRAPFDFYQVSGVFCLSVATGIAAWLLLSEIRRPIPRIAIAVIALGIAAWDISPFLKPFWKSPVPESTTTDFAEAMAFLRKAPLKGGVYPLSGRYFYLLTPQLTGHRLMNEAFQSYTMQRGMAFLQGSAFENPQDLSAFLRIAGVSYILIDKLDPDIQQDFQKKFRDLFPVAYSNESFDILENREALTPGFLAYDYIQAEGSGMLTANIGVRLAQYGFATIYAPREMLTLDGHAGTMDMKGSHLKPEAETRATRAFQAAESIVPIEETFNKAVLAPPSGGGWLIYTQAYHPDWTAERDGVALPVYRAFEGLMAVRVPDEPGEVTFRFDPPVWYDICIFGFLASWISLAVFALIFPVLPDSVRKRLFPALNNDPASHFLDRGAPRPPVERPLVIIPTFNEVESIREAIDASLAQDVRLHVLVVDDASIDGTPERIREHREYQARVHLLERPGKLGLGSAYKEGFQWAGERGYDCVLEMDADLSHDPADIPRLLDHLNQGADAAIGSRYLGGVRVLNWPQHRLFLSTSASRYTHIMTRLPLTDPTSGFKAIRIQALDALDWNCFRAEGYGFQIELHYYLWKAGAKLVEVPIIFTERRKGSTKMSLRIAMEAAIRVLLLGAEGGRRE